MATEPLTSNGTTAASDGWARAHLPSSGVLLGTLVEICGLRRESEFLRGSTARRWFRGEAIRPGSRARIIHEVASSAQASFGESVVLGSEELLTGAVMVWDGFRGTTSSMSNLLESSGGPWAIPALIVRGFVMAGITGCLSGVPDDGAASARSSVATLLREWQRAGRTRISRNEIAKDVR